MTEPGDDSPIKISQPVPFHPHFRLARLVPVTDPHRSHTSRCVNASPSRTRMSGAHVISFVVGFHGTGQANDGNFM